MDTKDPHCSMIIQWEPTGQNCVVTLPELEGCVTHGKTYEQAIAQGREAIAMWMLDEEPATLPTASYYLPIGQR